MRALGLDLPRTGAGTAEPTLALLDDAGALARVERPPSLIAAATEILRLTAGEPFLVAVDTPVVVPQRPARARPLEALVRRRLGLRLPPAGRSALGDGHGGLAGETLLAALAAAGRPCLPYPDRAGRQPCVAEMHPQLILKGLLWQASPLAARAEPAARAELFRAYEVASYRRHDLGARASWARQAVALDLVLAGLGALAPEAGYDLGPAREALGVAASEREVERAAALLDATLLAGTARRYLEAPESCLFLGDHTSGYAILPADEFVRRLGRSAKSGPRDRLFPQTSLRERLGPHARLRSTGLIDMPGRPQRTEAEFQVAPRYEFDNLDEMLWWKHCRHVDGPVLPTEGLHEMLVTLGPGPAPADVEPLKLARSRHRTLSFRFEPPAAWRARVPTRDGRTYPFTVLRAVYDTAGRAG